VAYAQDVTNDIQNSLCAGSNLDLNANPAPGECKKTNGLNKVNQMIRKLVNLLSVLVGVIAVIMIIVGGLRYVTSGGSDSSITGAKNTILYAIIGLIIVALAQVLVHFVLSNLTNA
jgi:hypothetical protein